MILVDTSVWIDFLRGKESAASLKDLLLENQVNTHPWIFGELMLGHLGPKRKQILEDLNQLPVLPVHSVPELHDFLEREKLSGHGISLIDLQLLYASLLEDCSLWTHDQRLQQLARKYGRVELTQNS